MGLDIDLYTPKIDIGDDNADDIIIEITGLKSISKFIGLEDTPLYYDNGKFFKVEDNKIIYTDIEWKDIKGNVDDSPEIVKVISDLVDDITDDIIDEKITLHNNNRDAHPYIQDILQDNYNTLNTKIDEVGDELSQEISHLSDNLNTEIENRETADNTLSETIQNETLARIEADSTLQNNIGTLSDNLNTEINNRTNADNLLREDINEISGNLAQEILNRQTQDGILQGNIDAEALARQNADTVLQDNINTLSQTVTDNDTAINNKVDGINTTLTNSINSLSNAVSSNYTTLDTKIDNTKNALDSDISDLSNTVTNNYNSLDARITTNTGNIATNAGNITTINSKIPNQASSSNQLADKDFVNSSIATNTANFIGTFNSVAELEAYTGTLTNNDYAFVTTTDAVGNTLYDRYKWNGSEWLFEYELNNSSFTAQQWASINSGSTIENINQIATNTNNIANLQANKQDILTAGSNIQINNNIISATDTTYTAGTGISITNGVISNTQTSAEWGNITGSLSDQLDLQHALNNKQDVLTAGTDLEIVEGGALVPLPEGYTQIEYITTDGDAYIDTGITVADTDSLNIIFMNTSSGTYTEFITGKNGSSGNTVYMISPASNLVQWNGRPTGVSIPKDKIVNLTLKSGELTYSSVFGNETKTFTGGSVSSNGTCLIGAGWSGTNTVDSRKFVGNIFKWQIKDSSNNLRFNGVPCYNSNNVYGLYDTVSNTFFPSIGANDFTGGNEVVAGTVINFTNASGYTKNIGTVTSVNNVEPDASGNVTIQTGGTVDQTFDGTSTNAQSGVAIVGAKFLQNTANGSGSVTILGTPANGANAVNIGNGAYTAGYAVSIGNSASSNGGYSISIGGGANTYGASSVAIGRGAKTNSSSAENALALGRQAEANAKGAIQLGKGANATANSMAIGFADIDGNGTAASYSMLDGTTGLIPDARISTNIARTTDIPTATSDLTNDSGYITNSAIGNGTITITQGGVPKGTFSTNQSGNTTIALDAGGGSGTVTDVQVNGTSVLSGGVASITVPTATSDLTNDSGFITSSDLPTNHVTTDTDQNITGTKTFVGQKKIAFKQSGTSDKLGFSLYNNSGTEKGYLEYNPSNTVDNVPLMTLGNYATASGGLTHVGFRKYSSISGASGAYNLLTPLISDARTPFNLTTTYTNFYLPLGFTDGTTTVKTAKSGMVDLSSIIPTVNNSTITFTQGGVTKGTITLNQASNGTIDFDAGGSGGIQNTATGTDSLTILGTSATDTSSLNIGFGSSTSLDGCVAIGCEDSEASVNGAIASNMSVAIGSGYDTYDGAKADNASVAIGTGTIANNGCVALGHIAKANNSNNIAIGGYSVASGNYNSIAIGNEAEATAIRAIQIGTGQNSTANSLNIGFGTSTRNYKLLDGTTGLIPDARISTNIQRTSNLVTTISSSSTDSQYPSAKCVYDIIGDIETLLQAV